MSVSPYSDRSQLHVMIHHLQNSSKFSPVSFSSSANTLYSGSASSSSNVSLTSVAGNTKTPGDTVFSLHSSYQGFGGTNCVHLQPSTNAEDMHSVLYRLSNINGVNAKYLNLGSLLYYKLQRNPLSPDAWILNIK